MIGDVIFLSPAPVCCRQREAQTMWKREGKSGNLKNVESKLAKQTHCCEGNIEMNK